MTTDGFFFLLGILVLILLHAMIGWFIGGAAKGRALDGAICGALLGVIGWAVIVFILDDHRALCGQCRGVIDRQAKVCKHCRSPVALEPVRNVPVLTVASPPLTRAWCGICKGRLDNSDFCPHCGAPIGIGI